MNATPYLGHLFAVTFRALYLRRLVLAVAVPAMWRTGLARLLVLIGLTIKNPALIWVDDTVMGFS